MFAQATGRTAAQRSGIFALSVYVIFAAVFFAGAFVYVELAQAQVAVTAVNASYSTNEDTTLNVTVPSGVLANDTGTTGSSVVVLKTNVSSGTLTLNADGSFDYTPASNYNGATSFTYEVGDGMATSSPATVSITINAVNDPPSFDAIANQNVNENSSSQNVSMK